MHEPRYAAYVAGEHVESADSLDALLSLVRDLHSPDTGEDVACWDGLTLVAVLQSNGSLIVLHPLHTAA